MWSREYVCHTFANGSVVVSRPNLEDEDNWVKNPNPV